MSSKFKVQQSEINPEKTEEDPGFISTNGIRAPADEFDFLPLAFFIISKTGKIIYHNPEAAKLFDFSKIDANKISIIDLIPPDYQQDFFAMLESAKNTGKAGHGEMTFVAMDGKTIEAKIHINRFADNTDRFRLAVTDVADLKHLYASQLHESESKYRELAENINEGIYLAERGFISMVNTPLLTIFGISKEEAIGNKVWQFVVPEKRDEVRSQFLRKVEMLDTSPVEVECLRKDGQRFWAEIKISIFKDQHKVFGVLSDITARKNVEIALKDSEQKYRSVVTAMNDGIILRDINGRVVAWNKASERILGLGTDEIKLLLSIHPGWNAVREDGAPFTFEDHPAIKTIKSGKPEHNVVMGIHNTKGELKWITINSQPIFGEDDKTIVSVVTSFSDITELKENEKKLLELNAIKDKLFSIIAHDLKSPYNAQMGFLELLMEENFSYTAEQRKHFVRMLYESARQSFALLDNLLVWSRNQTGRIPFNPVEINIGELIEGVIKFYQMSASVKNIKLKFKHNGNDQKVRADFEMINTVLRNLISNAIKFTPSGGKVSVSCQATKNEELLLTVKDTGIGIPKELGGRLFQNHDIQSSPGTENEKGTGLGLIIAREFVERNGGKIWVKSSSGKGSTLCFTLINAAINQH